MYCNYSKDKFKGELTFIKPTWWEEDMDDIDKSDFKEFMTNIETYYLNLIDKRGWRPQEARQILPNALKTELVMTGTEKEWEGFFKLRDAGSAHPQARELAEPLHAEFRKRGWCE